jgi:glycosyltransferase involved in cell wall biosynthesis
MRVLVATNDLTFNVALCDAWRAAGHSVHAGLSELWLAHNDYDLVHFHWPEELCNWAISAGSWQRARAMARIMALKGKTHLVCTVHNELPHADHSPAAEAFYAAFYAQMDIIGHFTSHSLDTVKARFPTLDPQAHLIHGMNDFRNLAALATGRECARERLGLDNDDFVIATFGQLRSADELQLFEAATARINGKLLFAARRPAPRGRMERMRSQWAFDRWVDTRRVKVLTGYLDDATAVAVFEACDAMVVVRRGGELNSGIPPLAMTFGTPLAAPDYGVFSETLAGAGNELYAPGDARSLASAIGRIAASDLGTRRASNRAHAMNWGWDTAVARIMERLA